MKTELMVEGRKVQVGLDRTVIGLPYPKLLTNEGGKPTAEELNIHDARKKQFQSQMKHIESVILTGKHYLAESRNKDLKRYHVRSEDDGSHLCICSLGFNFGTGVINFELNPSKLSTEQFADVGGLLMVMFNDHYEELYATGVVSHAEFYIDVSGEKLSNLVLIDSGRRTTKQYKGTTYHGSRSSQLVTTLYDKAKQQQAGGQLVRVEARLNRRDVKFRDLVEKDLFNPLGTSLVVEAVQMQALSKTWNAPHLANNIREFGLYGAIKNKPSRDKIWAFLTEQTVPWWQPDLFWSAHRELLLKLKPGNAGVFALH